MICKMTERGFVVYEFTDSYGIDCSLQESSLATDHCVWLGCNTVEVKKLVPGKGWVTIPLSEQEEILINTRMHLNQERAQQLIEKLQYFVEHGGLPVEDESDERA